MKKTNLNHPLKRHFPTPGTRHDFRTDQYVPTLDGKDISPTSFDEARALRIAQNASTHTPLGQHVSDGMPPLRGPSEQYSKHHPSCRPSDRDLVWHCSQCGVNESAEADAQRLADALKDCITQDGATAFRNPKYAPQRLRAINEIVQCALANWNATESPADADALEALDQLEQRQQ